MKNKEIEPKVFIRRFYSNIREAKYAAELLFSNLEVKEPVYIFKMSYGIHGFKREEFSLRLASEGARTDSVAIVYSTDLKHVINAFNLALSA